MSGVNIPTFTVTLRPEHFGDRDIPGTREPLLGGPYRAPPPPPWAKYQHAGEAAAYAGISILPEFPGDVPGLMVQPAVNQMWSETPWTSQPHSLEAANLPHCAEGCRLHSEAIHDSIKLIQHYASIPLRFLDGTWDPAHAHELINFHDGTATGSPYPLGGIVDEMRHLPMAPTRLNGELLRICRYTTSSLPWALPPTPIP